MSEYTIDALNGTPSQLTPRSGTTQETTHGIVQELTAVSQLEPATQNSDLAPVPNQEAQAEIDQIEQQQEDLDERYPVLQEVHNTDLVILPSKKLGIRCPRCVVAVKKYIKEIVFPRKKFFYTQDDLDDISTPGSVGHIILRAFRLNTRPFNEQRAWWDVVKHTIVQKKIRELRSVATRALKALILNRKPNLLIVALFLFQTNSFSLVFCFSNHRILSAICPGQRLSRRNWKA